MGDGFWISRLSSESGSGGPGKSGQQQTAAQVDSYRDLYKFRVEGFFKGSIIGIYDIGAGINRIGLL